MSSWHSPDEVPQVKRGNERYYIVAVFRAHSGKVYSFPALYLHDYPLCYEDGYECVCGDASRHTDDGCPTTGWYQYTAGNDGGEYSRLSMSPGDELRGWTEVPQFADEAAP